MAANKDLEQQYGQAMEEHGFIPDPENRRYGSMGLCWRHSFRQGGGFFWTYGQQDLYTIKIHDFFFHEDQLLEFHWPESLSVTWYESISGEEFSPCRRLVPGCVKSFIGGREPYRALIHRQIPIVSIGVEIKDATSRQWMAMADNDVLCALVGKLLPHTLVFFAVAAAYDACLYGVLGFPCHGGIGPLLLATLLWVVASQAFGVFLIAVLPTLRLALSACSLWGVVSFSISGFSFPVMAMHPSLQALSNLFPLRHYFLIYVSQTLNGYPMAYVWRSYFALLLFVLLPLLFLGRLKTVLLKYDYIP